MKITVMIASALAMLPIVATAAPHHKAASKHAAFICPVTGDKIASAKDAVGHETYKGNTYYFCCPECKPRFDKNRAGVVANAAKGKYEKM